MMHRIRIQLDELLQRFKYILFSQSRIREVLHGHLEFSLTCGCVIAFKLHTFGKISVKDLLCFTSNTPFSSLRTTLASNLAFLDEHNCGFTMEASKKGLRGNERCISVYCIEQA